MSNDNDIIKNEGADGQPSEKAKPQAKRRRRKKIGEKTPETNAQTPKTPVKRKAKRKSKPNSDVNSADPTAAIRQKVYEIDDSDVTADVPKILPILPEWEGSAPIRGAVPAPVKTPSPKAKNEVVEAVPQPSGSKLSAPSPKEKKAVAVKKAASKDLSQIKDAVLRQLAVSNVPISQESLLDTLGVPAMDYFAALDQLEAGGSVFFTRKQKLALPKHIGYISGVMHITTKGFGFLTPEDGTDDIFVAQRDLNGAMDGDSALLRLTTSTGSSRDGIIIRVTNHARSTLVGTYSAGSFIPDDRKIDNAFPAVNLRKNGAVDGQKVVCQIDYESDPVTAHIVEVLGFTDDPGTDVLSIIRAHDIPEAFPRAVKAAVRYVPNKVSDDDILRREDLRQITTVTIDGRDSKDFDDAVSLEKLTDGNYLLGVHIADVAHYVKDGGAIDKEARSRGTSVYFVDRVIPMLPEALSNGICSLNPDVDRLALSCFMEIDPRGTVVSHRLSETVIRSDYRLVYEDVSAALAGDKKLQAAYKPIMQMLNVMAELFEILHTKRVRRGSLEFELPECKILLDEKGKTKDVVLVERGIANRIIEEFMLICNETVAEHMFHLDRPMLYRVHEVPDEDRIKELSVFLSGFGLNLRGWKNGLHPKSLQSALSKAEGKPEESIVSRVSLRSLKKARYCEENLGHFGLAAEYYCHFTSPIRRYPDLIVHRVLKEHLHGKITKKRLEALNALMPELANSTSERERAAMETEREVDDLKKCEYLAQHVGEHFTGVISGVTSFGIFVELPNTCEGLVRVADMSDDYYVFYEKNYRYVGRHKNTVYRLGDVIEISVDSVDVSARRAAFSLVKEKEPRGRRPKKPRSAPRKKSS